MVFLPIVKTRYRLKTSPGRDGPSTSAGFLLPVKEQVAKPANPHTFIMKKFEVYQTAVDSVKDALIEALNNDEETNTLSEIWQHYLGLRAIADKAATDVSESIFGDTIISSSNQDYWHEDGISLTGNPVVAADTVPMDGIMGGMGKDVITFS